jgi:hypothetical protein
VGRAGVLIAAGPVVATALAQRAEARVCGQTGVSSSCPTFDCDGVWGWCWYAVGCCAGGQLKKICDCCVQDYPNVHGYCPTGTNVKCMVESCGADPRVQTVPLSRVGNGDLIETAIAVARLRFPAGAAQVVLGDVESALSLAVATAVGGMVGGPVLPVRRTGLDAMTLGAIRSLGAKVAVVAGPTLPGTIDAALTRQGVTVERVGSSADVPTFSLEVCQWAGSQGVRDLLSRLLPGSVPPRPVKAVTRTVCVVDEGVSGQAVPLAAAVAAGRGYPVVVGAAAARKAGVPSYLVGPEAGARVGEVPRSTPVGSGSILDVALALAALAGTEQLTDTVVVAPRQSPALAALAGLGGPIVLHEAGTLDGAREWLYRRQDTYGRPKRAYAGGGEAGLADAGYYELQSILNGYGTRYLTGSAGQGLPVTEQPVDERPPGRARP